MPFSQEEVTNIVPASTDKKNMLQFLYNAHNVSQ